MKTATSTLLLVVLMGLGGCSSGTDDTTTTTSIVPGSSRLQGGQSEAAPPTTVDQKAAGEVMKTLLQYVSDGQYGREWEELHPLQQAFVSKALFVKCSGDVLAGVEISDIKVKETFLEKTDIPGTDVTSTDSVAVTIEFTAHMGNLKPETATETFHAFLVEGRWRWASSDAEAYKRGECPD